MKVVSGFKLYTILIFFFVFCLQLNRHGNYNFSIIVYEIVFLHSIIFKWWKFFYVPINLFSIFHHKYEWALYTNYAFPAKYYRIMCGARYKRVRNIGAKIRVLLFVLIKFEMDSDHSKVNVGVQNSLTPTATKCTGFIQ